MIYRTFFELDPSVVAIAERILKARGIAYLKEYNPNYGMYWILVMTKEYETIELINSEIGIRGKLNGVPA